MEKLGDYFSGIADFRVKGRCLHELSDILGLILCGVLADCDNFIEVADFGEDNIDFLKAELGFNFPNGIPSEDTLERIFKHLSPKALQDCYAGLLKDISLAGRQLALDGKELRSATPRGKKHSKVQMVNVWVEELGLSFGQQQVEEKSNEITAIPQLLDMLECKGAVVSIDAIGCQKEIVEQIREKGADYVIALKKNQKELYEQVTSEMDRQKSSLNPFISRDLGHGRAEERKVYILENLEFVDERHMWKDLSSVALVERKVIREGKEQQGQYLYISSLQGCGERQMCEYIRKQWGIENGLHWQLDVTFREDDSVVREENALVNLHLIRKWALFILKKDPEKISMARKRKKAARNNQYLKQLITS